MARSSSPGDHRRRPRQADIARVAGVSQATVSLIVNGRAGRDVQIAPETIQRVHDAIEELGYAINPAGRSLAGGRNRLLGVYTFESLFPVDQRDFYHPFLLRIEREAERQGWDLLLFTSATSADGRRSVYHDNVSRLRLADGSILLGKDSRTDELQRLIREQVPFVYLGRRDVPGTEIDHVTADYADATGRVVDHLVELGHRDLAYLPGSTAAEPTADRNAGFEAAVDRHALEVPEAHRRPADIPDAVETDWLESVLADGVTALVAHHPEVAQRVLDLLAERGERVPADRSVVSLNDPTAGTDPALAGFRIPREAMGVHSVRILIEKLTDPVDVGPRQLVLHCELAINGTAGPARPARSTT